MSEQKHPRVIRVPVPSVFIYDVLFALLFSRNLGSNKIPESKSGLTHTAFPNR